MPVTPYSLPSLFSVDIGGPVSNAQTGSGTGGGTGGDFGGISGLMGALRGAMPREGYPTQQLQMWGQGATNYPTYMRNLGEQMAQQQAQTAMNQGIRTGMAPQGYMAAMDARNRARLAYMSQAGQEEAKIAQTREEQMMGLRGQDITQRGQDLNALMNMYAIYNRPVQQTTLGGGGGGYSRNVSSNPMAGRTIDIQGRVSGGGYNTQSAASADQWRQENIYRQPISSSYWNPATPQASSSNYSQASFPDYPYPYVGDVLPPTMWD